MIRPCLAVCKLLSRKINILHKAQLQAKPEHNPSMFLTQPKASEREQDEQNGNTNNKHRFN